MARRIYVYPYDQLSEGAGMLAKALDTQKLLRKKSKYRAQDGDILVNWGASDFPAWADRHIPEDRDVDLINLNVEPTIDKREFFKRAAQSEYIPKWTTDRRFAEADFKFPVLCRTKVKGKDGEGIVIAETKADMIDAPLYVQLEEKTQEYRVHVGKGANGETSIIGVCQKLRPNGFVGGDIRIRNGAAGCNFYWTVKGLPVVLPDKCRLAVLDVFKRFPLTFGGIDVIYDSNRDKAFVLEINTAPELTPKAAEMYAEFFLNNFVNPVAEPAEAFEAWKQNGVDALPVQIEPEMDAFMEWFWGHEGPADYAIVEQCKAAFWVGYSTAKAERYEGNYDYALGRADNAGIRIDVV